MDGKKIGRNERRNFTPPGSTSSWHCQTTTAKSIIEQLSHQHPSLAKYKLLIAVNEEYADADTVLNDGDEIAIFTAVSGG